MNQAPNQQAAQATDVPPASISTGLDSVLAMPGGSLPSIPQFLSLMQTFLSTFQQQPSGLQPPRQPSMSTVAQPTSEVQPVVTTDPTIPAPVKLCSQPPPESLGSISPESSTNSQLSPNSFNLKHQLPQMRCLFRPPQTTTNSQSPRSLRMFLRQYQLPLRNQVCYRGHPCQPSLRSFNPKHQEPRMRCLSRPQETTINTDRRRGPPSPAPGNPGSPA